MSRKTEKLLTWFYTHHARLERWVGESEQNAIFFAADPVTAIRFAGLQLDDDLICELECAAHAIAINAGGTEGAIH